MFLDEAEVEFSSGRGGSGSASFHREKHVPRGGPNGADGGKGGDIILIADRGKRTLYDFKLQRKFQANNGDDAVGNKRGKDAADIEVKVPVGTIVIDADLDAPIVDLNTDGFRFVLCKGGKGGFGNLHYTSSTRQAPTFAQKGAPGESTNTKLELKLLADVGIVGLPNAGKSTLISRISAAKPKVADYPFTTIEPNLGVVSFRDETFTVADMPGLVEGASEGKGLGHQFLRHVERTRVLIHLVECEPMDQSNPVENFELIERELGRYSQDIWERPRIVAISKIDACDARKVERLEGDLNRFGFPILAISAVSGAGLDALLKETISLLRKQESKPAAPILVPAMSAEADLSWEVERAKGGYRVLGKRIQRLVAMTDLGNEEALQYLHRRLERLGVIGKLRELGAKEGDNVAIGELEFSFSEES